MKRIEILTRFKHGTGSYYPGEVRVVEESDAGLFCGNGWARDISGDIPTGSATPADVKLSIDHGVIGQAATSPGEQ